jgi:uncharacterized protein (TIRG00374 family)
MTPGRTDRTFTVERIARLLLLVVGLLLLAYVVYRTGTGKVVDRVLGLGPWFVVVLGISATWFLLNTLGWRATFEGRPPAFGRLFRVHLISEAISNVTPLMALGGEPMKILFLKQQVCPKELTATVIADNIVHITSAVAFMLLGILYGASHFVIDPVLLGVLWAGIAATGLVVVVIIAGARFGFIAAVARGFARVARLVPARSASLIEGASSVERIVSRFLFARPGSFAIGFSYHLIGRLMGALEAWLILLVSGVPVTFGAAVFIIAVIHVLVNLVFSFVPSQFGIQESAAYLLFGAVGLDPSAAVAMMLVRRIRGFFWIGVGLLLLGVWRRSTRSPEGLAVDS